MKILDVYIFTFEFIIQKHLLSISIATLLGTENTAMKQTYSSYSTFHNQMIHVINFLWNLLNQMISVMEKNLHVIIVLKCIWIYILVFKYEIYKIAQKTKSMN